MKRAWLVLLSGAAMLSCNDTTIDPGIQLNLDRPVDISFVCYGNLNLSNNTTQLTAQPPQWCNARSVQLTPNSRDVALSSVPTGQTAGTDDALAPKWYGFILQSASGSVAVSRMPSQADDQFASSLSTTPGAPVVVDDADPRAPGKNAISVGEAPIALVNDLSACYEVTANAGSCDLTALDINSVLTTDSSVPVRVERRSVSNGSGQPLRAKPAAMVIQPNANQPIGNACPAQGDPVSPKGIAYIAYPGCSLVAGIDLATGQMQSGIRLLGGVATVLSPAEVATMSCPDECGTGQALKDTRPSSLSLQVSERGATTRLAIGADNAAVLTVVDLDNTTFLPLATAPLQITLAPTPGKPLGVASIALSPQIAMGNTTNTAYPRRNNNTSQQILKLIGAITNPDNTTTPVFANPPTAIPADPIDGSPGGEGQYVYAVANDGSVRVADVLRVKKECDTNVDTRYVRALTAKTDIPKLQCFPVGDPATPPRRTGAKGPGIELPSDGPPVSVAIVKGLDRPTTTQPAPVAATETAPAMPYPEPVENPPSPSMLIGYFAMISASSGQLYVVNVDDDDGPDVFDPTKPQATAPVLAMAHQLRDAFGDRAAKTAATSTQCTAADPALTSTGGPRAPTGPVPNAPANTYPATPRVNELNKTLLLPTLQQEQCVATDETTDPKTVSPAIAVSQIQLPAAPATRDVVFPDLRSVRTESWALTWEGSLSNDTILRAVDGPVVRTGQLRADGTGVHLLDQTQPFCEMGVEPLDYVQLRGCSPTNNGSDCPNGYTCYVSKDNRVPNLGSCMLAAEAPRLADACRDFLTSARRYAVSRSESGELLLVPRKHVLTTTPVDGCVSDMQCKTLADYAAGLRTLEQPGVLTGATPTTDPHAWACRADDDRKPVATGKRCLETCATSADCDVGTACVGGVGTDKTSGTCMESVAPPQACVNGPQRFEVHASDAFVVTGTVSGYVHPFITKGGAGADANQCVRDPNASPLKVGRIPLDAPACDPAANPYTGVVGAGFEANACSTTVMTYEAVPNVSGTCLQETTTTPVLGFRSAPAIKFRNTAFTITMVDPWSPGDLTCTGDRAAGLGKIPLLLTPGFDAPAVTNYQLVFDLNAGFTPLQLGGGNILPAFPVKVVRGPADSIWVMDDGDFQAVALGQSSTRGQVYRVSISSLSTVNLLQ